MMADFDTRRTKLPTEIIVMVLSELTHAEAWRLRILCSTINDWVHNVLVKRALQSSALIARSPASFIFYEAPDSVHGLQFSFLQKHGSSAIFQARTTEKRELELFNQKTYLHIVAHLSNNNDPIIIRHLKVKELSLDRDSVTLQCNWRNLLASAFSMSSQQRVNQAQSIRPQYVWQPARIDGMPGKWRKGLSWLHTESQVSSASQRSSSTTSSSQHMYGLVAYESASATTSGSHGSAQGTQSSHSSLTQATNVTHISTTSHGSSSLFSSSQLSQINVVPQSSPPRHDGRFTTMPEDTGLSTLNSISAYQDSSCSSNPSQRLSTGSDGRGGSILETLGLDGNKLNPAPALNDDLGSSIQSVRSTTPEMQITVVNRYTFVVGPEEPADRERSPPPVASSPMSESLYAQSATIRPALRGGGSSPLGVLEEEDCNEGEDADASYMLASEHDVSRMLVADSEFEEEVDGEDEDLGDDEVETQPEIGPSQVRECGELGRTDSKSSVPESQGTTFEGTDSVGYARSQTLSFMTDITDVEVVSAYSVDEKERRIRTRLSDDLYDASASVKLGETQSLPLLPRQTTGINPRLTLSPESRRRRMTTHRLFVTLQ
ncbi:hypothetical protein RSOLAG1IB_10585 [Rhizoctonia solani AG-1 IB]|uniref:F-box domain-containing protein n=1 Tax=Thanatephorus cucumeris (strain AG1-IB / isolate 7/3/14) TaxID=1108050 RepID=A0A0B7G1G4_THACB|nr:hypothetical protein RSOLAG1IB_10585 [Rhizoctonia solani AG-1 IB]